MRKNNYLPSRGVVLSSSWRWCLDCVSGSPVPQRTSWWCYYWTLCSQSRGRWRREGREREGDVGQEISLHSVNPVETSNQLYVHFYCSCSWNMSMFVVHISSERRMKTCFNSTEKVKAHLKTYFDRCQQALVGGIGVDQELSLLCTQCFEVSYKLVVLRSSHRRMDRHNTETMCTLPQRLTDSQ